MRFLYFLLSVFVFFGCSKSKQNLDFDVDNRNSIQLDLNTLFYEDTDGLDQGGLVSSNKGMVTSKDGSNEIVGLDVFSDFQIDESSRISFLKSNKASVKATKDGVNYPENINDSKFKSLERGVKYMVLVFDNDDNHIGTQLATVGDVAPITVKFKEDYIFSSDESSYYRLVAFTFNTKDESDFYGYNLDPSVTGNKPNLVFPSDKEFYYHNNVFVLDPSENSETPPKINVVFFPQTVKIGVSIDGRGVDSKVKRVNGRFGPLSYRKSASFDLKLNKVLSVIDISEGEFPYSFSLEANADVVSVARYVYLPENESVILNDFDVTLTDLVLQRNDSIEESTVLQAPRSKSFSFSNVNLVKGKFYNGRLNLISGFQMGNLIWSYGNLYYTKGADQEYKFRNSPRDGHKNQNDYWSFKRSLPISERSNKDIKEGVDPCSFVYPGGWRMPTKAESKAFSFTNTADLKSFRFYDQTGAGSASDYDYAEFVNVHNQTIRFYTFGMLDGGGNTGEGINALYWNSTGSLSSQRDVFVVTVTSTGVMTDVTPTTTTSNGSLGFPDYVNLSTRGLNIRCVRPLQE